MKQLYLLFMLITAPCALSAQMFLYFPESVPQGEPLPLVFLHENPAEETEVRLVSTDGTIVVMAECFPVPEEGKRGVFASLLGVPSTLDPGSYRIILFDGNGEGTPFLEREVKVTEKTFRQENIPLSIALSGLRQSDDPQKVKESRELLTLLNTCNLQSYYHDTRHISPLPENRETSSFGDRRRYIYTDSGEASAIHNGIDLAAPVGTIVYASASGKVVFAGMRIITGNTVVIEHLPGFYGLYYHLDSTAVNEGDFIRQGTIIGTVGMTGLATGPHLHWELRAAGVAVNPGTFLKHSLIDKEGIMSMINGKL